MCTSDYIGETEGKLIDHNKRDKNSNVQKQSCEEDHSHVWDKGIWKQLLFNSQTKVLFELQLKPSLNVK